MAAIVASAFAAIASIHLAAQGLYYDELHQAPAAFALLGRRPELFSGISLGRIPLLNMSYSGALKSFLYGTWMRLTESSFSVESWRALGIAFSALGLVVLLGYGAARLPLRTRAMLGVLLLTDTSLILMSRHDWGPVALSFLLRCAAVSLWLRVETDDRPVGWRAAGMGVLLALAVFEKLSSVAFALAFALLIFANRGLRSLVALRSFFLGGLLGSLPLALVNVLSMLRNGRAISLEGIGAYVRLWSNFPRWAWGYLSLGSGDEALSWILDEHAPGALSILGTISLLAGVLAAGCLVVWGQRWARLAALAGLAWLMTGVGIWLLPKPTWFYHYILGTPFQYLALALAVAPTEDRVQQARATQMVRPVALACALTVVLTNGYGTFRLVGLLREERTNHRFSPDLTALGAAAAHRGPESIFLAADWGVATQVYCLSDGHLDVRELFWNYSGTADLIAQLANHNVAFVIGLNPPSGVAKDARRGILNDMGALRGWIPAPVDADLHLRDVEVHKFVRER